MSSRSIAKLIILWKYLTYPIRSVVKCLTAFFSSLITDRDGYISRKLAAAWVLTFLVAFLFTGHILHQLVTGVPVERLIDSTDFIGFLSLLWGAYFASDVGNHFIYTRRTPLESSPKEEKQSKIKTVKDENSGDEYVE